MHAYKGKKMETKLKKRSAVKQMIERNVETTISNRKKFLYEKTMERIEAAVDSLIGLKTDTMPTDPLDIHLRISEDENLTKHNIELYEDTVKEIEDKLREAEYGYELIHGNSPVRGGASVPSTKLKIYPY